MLDTASSPGRLTARPAPVLPVGRLLSGKRVEDAADVLPRLFALCRAAQASAARRALGLSPEEDEDRLLAREVLRDHLMKLCLHWPAKVGQAPQTLPSGWREGTGVAKAVFGASAPPPDPPEFEAFLRSGLGVAPVLKAIDACFPSCLAATPRLASLDAKNAFLPGPVENSVAGRQAAHPVMLNLEATRGRGPLWRAAARLYDLADALAGRLPAPHCPAPGHVIVTAARGAYAVNAETEAGRVRHFARVTPTDHLLAAGGILERSLAALPADRAGLAPLLLEILDPCTPVRLHPQEAEHA